MRASAEPFLSLRGVSKIYRTGVRETVAVSDATFDLGDGEFLALVGPSGCGKSTLLKILAGLHPHDGGELRIGHADFDAGRDVGVAFQQPLLLKWRRVLDNVMLPAEILGLPPKATRERARDLLALVGLSGNEDSYPYELSGGMQQRVSLARALVHDPKLVLLDEPFGALDALTRERMNLEIRRIWASSRKTIVLVTHSVQEAVFCATQVAVLTTGPARMADHFAVDLPEPRELAIRNTLEFGALARRVYDRLGID
ncbi:MAG TPA: ABC transporter ATP-binding protein [Falsiroseomonas sp.]|jgi:NitT/TauT family transport system ATP-binding protein|nr:ABC transporter ATP-binding protein [Falsiroseomonas sp.]